jgi:hypothetical protein
MSKQYVWTETVGFSLTDDAKEFEIIIETQDQESVYLYRKEGEQLTFLGSLDQANFLRICERMIELWKAKKP